MHPQPILAVLVVAGLGLAPASAETLTVCATGCDYTSINAAVDAASDGYVILLSAETYTEGSAISTDGKAIILRGAVDQTGAPTSIIDGAGSHRVLNCQEAETASTVLENLVVRNGSANSGGGMYVSGSPTIRNCVFTDNSAVLGGGVHCYLGRPSLSECRFTSNITTQNGGGMWNENGTANLTNCSFEGNVAGGDGGAMWNESGTTNLTSCSFEENVAGGDGGAMCYPGSSAPFVQGCVFTSNAATGRGGAINISNNGFGVVTECTFEENSALLGGALAQDRGTVAVSGSMATGNVAGAFGGFAFVDGGELNVVQSTISENVATGFAGGVYATTDRVAIAATNVCGNSLPQLFGWSNIGDVTLCRTCDDCQEGAATSVPCETGIRGDFNCDGVFDDDDYLAIRQDLGICAGDLNLDGVVDGADLGLLFTGWGRCP